MTNIYEDGTYLKNNPSWDIEDSRFKFNSIDKILIKNSLKIKSICEIGCGAGEILNFIKNKYPDIKCTGYDIAYGLENFWSKIDDVNFNKQDFLKNNNEKFDIIYFADVLEHLDSPFEYLLEAKKFCNKIIIYLPLDISVFSVLKNLSLIRQVKKVGHIHFYTKEIFLEILRLKNFHIVDYSYTDPFNDKELLKNKSIPERLLAKIRSLCSFLNKSLSARILGGQTLTIIIE